MQKFTYTNTAVEAENGYILYVPTTKLHKIVNKDKLILFYFVIFL